MPVRTVDANTLKIWLDKNEAVLVDVREAEEHQASSIPGATLLPLANVSRSTLPNYAGKKLVVHCRKGGRGGTACEKLLAEDPNLDIYNLEGGIEAWAKAGQSIKADGAFFLPLDRQVQLTIGLCLFIGSWLGYSYESPAWFLLTGLLGTGLIIAGASGSCGLALLMAKAPWNQKSTAASYCKVK